MDSATLLYPHTVAALPLVPAAMPMPKSIDSNNNPSPPCTPAHTLQQLVTSKNRDGKQQQAAAAATTPLAPPPPPHLQAYPTPCLSQHHGLSSNKTQHQRPPQTPVCPPRVQIQQLCLPRDRHAHPTMLPIVDNNNCGRSGPGCQPSTSMDPKLAKANFVDSLVDTATVVIESIWPPPPSTAMSPQQQQQQKALPLRTFVQETLKRSRSSYSTLQTALYYLYKIRNKVPSEFLKRRNDQLYHNYQILSAHAAGLATPPPSPMHLQQDTFPTTSSTSSSASAVGATLPHSSSTTIDYFSLRASAPGNGGAQHASLPAHHTLPSPVSTASNASMSPPDSCESSTSPSTSTDSTTSSPSSTSANQPATQQLQHQQQQIQHQQQCNKILYCGRRTFLAALMVASKYLQDRNYSNKAWAKISGLSIKEINANELVFLKLMDYSLFVSHETFMRWTALLLAHGQEATRRFMQSADAASAAAIAMRVRHHQQQQQLQQQQQQQYLHSCLAASSNAIRAPSTTATAAASSCLGSGTVTTTTNTTTTTSALSNRDSNLASTPKQGDRGMKWAATHSRPDKQQLVQQQQQRTSAAASATETHEQEYRTMLPPHLVLTPPDHADEAYPVRESLNTTVSSIVHSLTATSHNLRHHPSASATHMTTTAVDNHVDYAAAIIPQAEHAGCKRRRDSDWLVESCNKSVKACQLSAELS